MIAHRFAYALRYGVDGLADAPLLGHRCDNPLCQRVGVGHVEVSSARQNRLEWLSRRDLAGSPLADARGARGRAEALRALARVDPCLVQDEIRRGRSMPPAQLAFW